MKHPLGSTLEFMPDKELRLFILHHVITPFLEQKEMEGIRLSARIDYKAENQILHGPCLDRKGKSTDAQVTVVCSQNPSWLTQHLLSVQIVPTDNDCADFVSYSIQGFVRKDERGYYLTESRVEASK
jgi:hypothetical protein